MSLLWSTLPKGTPVVRLDFVRSANGVPLSAGTTWLPAAHVPDAAKKKPAPAILCVHGHWRGAKQDPVVQSRCIGAAKLGFVVLCVDAFGAGERGSLYEIVLSAGS